jgi:type I site-specific restriction endonuclease
MPNKSGEGFVDYVLWGDDGLPLGVVEAKRTRRDARIGQRQAELYANCLEKEFGQRPVIFYTNGYEHWLWDDLRYPPREMQGFLTKDELQLIVQRRSTRRPLAKEDVDPVIVERFYQTRAIRRVTEAFEATGAGKTRTVVALADLLMRANWVKRVLFQKTTPTQLPRRQQRAHCRFETMRHPWNLPLPSFRRVAERIENDCQLLLYPRLFLGNVRPKIGESNVVQTAF